MDPHSIQVKSGLGQAGHRSKSHQKTGLDLKSGMSACPTFRVTGRLGKKEHGTFKFATHTKLILSQCQDFNRVRKTRGYANA